jgi:hypothetical protein
MELNRMKHKPIRTFKDAEEFLGEVSLEKFAREHLLLVNLNDPMDRQTVEIGVINHARALRDFLEQE